MSSNKLTLPIATVDPAAVPNGVPLYAKDVAGVKQPFARASDGTILQLGGGMSIGGAVVGGTVGSMLFVGTGPTLAQDNANLFWNNTTKVLGIGTNTPGLFTDTKLEIFRVGHCVTSIITLTAASDAVLILGTSSPGDNAIFTDESDGLKFKFATGDVSTDAARNTSTRMTIHQTGQVSIGETTLDALHQLSVVQAASGSECIKIKTTAANGFSDMVWFDSAGVEKGGIGYANASAASFPSKNFFYSPGAVDWVMGDGTTTWFRWYATTNSVGFEIANGSAGAVSASGTAKLRYNSGTDKLQVSKNGAAYVDIV